MKTRQIPAVGKTSDQKRSREFMGSVMTIVGGACWGLSGCCGQFLFEHRGVEAPWLVALRLVSSALRSRAFWTDRAVSPAKRTARHRHTFSVTAPGSQKTRSSTGG